MHECKGQFPEIETMLAKRKTLREIVEYFGFKDKNVVKQLLKRERRKQRKLEVWILPRPKGKLRKELLGKDIIVKQAYEIRQLRLENDWLRDFLQSTESESKRQSML